MNSRAQPDVSFTRLLAPVWLVTAGWDFLCATALSVFAYHRPASAVWRGVASTVLGPRALEGGSSAVGAGIALHFAVALTWSAIFVAAVRWWPALRRTIESAAGALAVAAVYGPIIWLVMSLVVIPLATGRLPDFGFRWWVQIVAHIPFVTVPLVLMARRGVRAHSHRMVVQPAESVA